MGVQWGEMGANNLSDVWVFSQFRIVCLGFFGAYIIPKWLSKVPGPEPIAILFG